MSKKLLFLISFVLALALANSVFAQGDPNWPVNYWSGWGDDPCAWGDANNWYTANYWWDDVNFPTEPARFWSKAPNSVPDADRIVNIGTGVGWYQYPPAFASTPPIGYPVIDGETAEVYNIGISTGPNDTNGPGRLDVKSGSLTSIVWSDDWLSLMLAFVPGGTGTFNQSGGTVICDNYDGEGGYLGVSGWNYEDPTAGSGVGTFTMTGGEFYCYHLDIPESDVPDPNAKGFLNMYGGTLYTTADVDWTEFWMGMPGDWPDARVDITDGKIIINTYELDWIETYIEEGKIIAFGGAAPRAELYRDYNITNAGKTTVQAIATELEQAWRPRPVPGAGINYRPTLTWAPGDYVQPVNEHIVYFSTDRDAVVNRTAPSTTRDVNNFNVKDSVGILDWTTNYFWQVEEVNGSHPNSPWPGVVWSFTTSDHLAVEDVDSYVDTTAMTAVWTIANGAQISLETNPDYVRARQSLLFGYRNAFTGGKGYLGSEVEADTTDLEIGSDWVSGGPEALVLYFRGDADNAQEGLYKDDYHINNDQMYVAVEDGSANVGIVKYDQKYDYDMNDIKKTSWQEWNIDLADPILAAVDMSNVAYVYIGFGGFKTGQAASGAGTKSGKYDTVWFDDIGLYPIRCVPKYGPATDVTNDCITSYPELDILAADWLKSGFDVAAQEPNDPLVHFSFDIDGGSGIVVTNEGSLAAAGNGTIFDLYSKGPGGPLTWETPGANHPDVCEPNYCIQLSAFDEQAVIMDSNLNDVVGGGFTTNTLTISAWVKRTGDQLEWTGLVFSSSQLPSDDPDPHAGLSLGANDDWTAGGSEPAQNHLAYHWATVDDACDATPDGEDQIWWWRSGLLVPDGVWTFAAVSIQPEEASIYMSDGTTLQKSTNIETHLPTTFEDPFNIGRDPRILWGSRTLLGQIDDVQIFDYALSDNEILYLAAGPAGSTHVNVDSDVDCDDSDDIDFFDYGFIANDWLIEVLWPLRP